MSARDGSGKAGPKGAAAKATPKNPPSKPAPRKPPASQGRPAKPPTQPPEKHAAARSPVPQAQGNPPVAPTRAPPPASHPTHVPWTGHDLHHTGRPRITWSLTEAWHLAMGVIAITVCFALIRATPEFPDRLVEAFTDGWALLASFVAVATGFVLHELAHKVVAQRYGHWAEFRADPRYLAIGVAVAAFAPFFVAAPGAVWIQGRPPPRQYGLISLVGPGTNVVVAGAAFGLHHILRASDPTYGLNPDGALELVVGMVALVNAILAVFNLIPFNLPFLGTLDGLKVWRWSKLAWAASFAGAAALLVAVYLGPGSSLIQV